MRSDIYDFGYDNEQRQLVYLVGDIIGTAAAVGFLIHNDGEHPGCCVIWKCIRQADTW